MTIVHRVLYPRSIDSLEEYLRRGGGRGLEAARNLAPGRLVAKVTASGLRGRGGAGFPVGRKWRTVARNRSAASSPSTVVVNGAEGEPGTFKDRTILRTNPYVVVEGALIAAKAVGADLVIVALKRTFESEVARTRVAIREGEGTGYSWSHLTPPRCPPRAGTPASPRRATPPPRGPAGNAKSQHPRGPLSPPPPGDAAPSRATTHSRGGCLE